MTYIEFPSWPQYLTAWPIVFIINEIFSFVEKFSVSTSSSHGSTLINAKVMIPRAPIPTKIANKVILKVEVTSLWPCQAKYTFMDHFCDQFILNFVKFHGFFDIYFDPHSVDITSKLWHLIKEPEKCCISVFPGFKKLKEIYIVIIVFISEYKPYARFGIVDGPWLPIMRFLSPDYRFWVWICQNFSPLANPNKGSTNSW